MDALDNYLIQRFDVTLSSISYEDTLLFADFLSEAGEQIEGKDEKSNRHDSGGGDGGGDGDKDGDGRIYSASRTFTIRRLLEYHKLLESVTASSNVTDQHIAVNASGSDRDSNRIHFVDLTLGCVDESSADVRLPPLRVYTNSNYICKQNRFHVEDKEVGLEGPSAASTISSLYRRWKRRKGTGESTLSIVKEEVKVRLKSSVKSMWASTKRWLGKRSMTFYSSVKVPRGSEGRENEDEK